MAIDSINSTVEANDNKRVHVALEYVADSKQKNYGVLLNYSVPSVCIRGPLDF